MKPFYIPRGYFDFLLDASGKTIEEITYMFSNSKTKFAPCFPIYHLGSCKSHTINVFYTTLKFGLRFYVIFYSLTRLILRTPGELIHAPFRTAFAIFRCALGSTGFLLCIC